MLRSALRPMPSRSARSASPNRSRSRNNEIGYRVDPNELIADTLHARCIFRNHAKGRPFALIQYRTIEGDDAIDHGHLNTAARSPRLLIDLGENAFAYFRIAGGGDRGLAQQINHRLHHIGTADDADETTPIYHGQALDMLGLHERDGLAQRCLGHY